MQLPTELNIMQSTRQHKNSIIMISYFHLSVDPLQWSALESGEGWEPKALLKHIVDFEN